MPIAFEKCIVNGVIWQSGFKRLRQFTIREEFMAILLTSDTAPSTGSLIAMIVVYAVIFGAMYLFMFRPQRKEQKRVAAMIAAVEIGDYVLTNSGFYGSVIDITEDTVIVEFGNNRNCRIPMQKSAIAQIEKANGEQQ